MTPEFRHEMVVANAGCGKTYKLVTRMIQLMALGVEPAKIAALTFTRKAAGEFLNEVFLRLANASEDSKRLHQLAADTGIDSLDAARCLQMLRRLLAQPDRLSMGTIDSLFGKIVSAFPLELGLGESFSVMEESEITSVREETVARLFAAMVGKQRNYQILVGLFREISRSRGERKVFESVLNSVEQMHQLFLAMPAGAGWGNAESIWPNGTGFLAAPDLPDAVNSFRAAVHQVAPGLSEEATNILESILEEISNLQPGSPLSDKVSAFFKQKLVSDPKTGEMQIMRQKAGRIPIQGSMVSARRDLAKALVKVVFLDCLRRSRGLYETMQRYEELYDQQIRSRGRLTFDDVTTLLDRKLSSSSLWQSEVGYRLDGRLDHWLLDEFQDTSRRQWRVLECFLDEVLQDPSGLRSLFYVGDAKQAIYQWRGGDPALFHEIADRYNREETRIHEVDLQVSYRSCAPVIDCVNAVFGRMDEVAGRVEWPKEEAVNEWNRSWREHRPSSLTAGLRGYVSWIQADSDDADPDSQKEESGAATPADRAILKVLLEIEPWKRGWSCAALKRTNDGASRLAALLQTHGIPVSLEGKTNPYTDNPLGLALLAALRVICVPGDKSAGILLESSPFCQSLLSQGWEAFRASSMQSIARLGAAHTIRDWLLLVDLDQEPFLRHRAAEFLSGVRAWECSTSTPVDLLSLIQFLKDRSRQEAESPDVVRVMNIHQSKGLTFDMVLVSELDHLSKKYPSGQILLDQKPAEKGPSWGLLPPAKDFSLQDQTIWDALKISAAREQYSTLCVNYVALTRPRRGLYLVTKPYSPTSKGKFFSIWLQHVLPQTAFGDPLWYEERPISESSPRAVEAVSALPSLVPPIKASPRPLQPSSLAVSPDRSESGGKVVSVTDRSDAMRLGEEVHRLLASLEWVGQDFPSLPSSPAGEMVARFLQSPAGKLAFCRPEGAFELWRERAFDVLLDGAWVSGVFDRVILSRDPDFNIDSVHLMDFKVVSGDSHKDLDEIYRLQILSYRKALAALFQIPIDSVRASLLPISLS